MDFESAVWGAFLSVMPDCERKGCAFHLNQAMWRNVQELELQQAYANDGATYTFIRKVMALPFIPAEHCRTYRTNIR